MKNDATVADTTTDTTDTNLSWLPSPNYDTHTLMEHPVSLLYLVHFRINTVYYMRNLLEDSIWQYLSDMYYNDLELQVEPL